MRPAHTIALTHTERERERERERLDATSRYDRIDRPALTDQQSLVVRRHWKRKPEWLPKGEDARLDLLERQAAKLSLLLSHARNSSDLVRIAFLNIIMNLWILWTDFTWLLITCVSDFLFAYIVTLSLSPLFKQLRVAAGNSPAKKLSLLLKMLRNSIRN